MNITNEVFYKTIGSLYTIRDLSYDDEGIHKAILRIIEDLEKEKQKECKSILCE